ncbi:MAG: sigma-70 family RNA polymerase sigma factor [Ignavibacteriaceae bacterium]|jgi:RNA polymerase sigma-70 factor (ECF subfamily)
MKNLTDLEIIESVIRGNQSDYAIIIDRYKSKAFSLVKRMLKNEMDAEEVLQDCFIKAYDSLKTFRRESKFSTWFYRIVYNTTLTKLSNSKRKIESQMSSVDEHFDLESDYDFKISEKKDMSEFIKNIIEKLPENYSLVLTMHYFNDMSCEEISETLGATVSNVKVMLHRSRNALRDLVQKNNYAEELL